MIKNAIEKDIIDNLITEGEVIIEKAVTSGLYGIPCYKGEEYETWISKCMYLMENYFKDTDWYNKFQSASKNAVGNGKEYYDTMIGVLKAIKECNELGVLKEDNIEKNRKIFVSHCSKNRFVTDKFVNLLKNLGISNTHIYYSSYEETGAKYLENCLDSIKREFKDNELIVIFMISREFYSSDICLAEMGATWVNNVKYIPFIIPPLSYKDIKGVVDPMQNSIMLLDENIETKLDTFKDTILKFLGIDCSIESSEWTRLKKEFIENVQSYAKTINDINEKIIDIKIIENKVILKIELENNTNNRYQFEGLQLYLKIADKDDVEKYIDDWSIKSIVLKPYEKVNFFVSFDNDDNIKRSKIILNKSTIKLENYQSE